MRTRSFFKRIIYPSRLMTYVTRDFSTPEYVVLFFLFFFKLVVLRRDLWSNLYRRYSTCQGLINACTWTAQELLAIHRSYCSRYCRVSTVSLTIFAVPQFRNDYVIDGITSVEASIHLLFDETRNPKPVRVALRYYRRIEETPNDSLKTITVK